MTDLTKPITQSGWSKGIVNRVPAERITPDGLADAVNVDLLADGTVTTRYGTSRVAVGDYRDLFADESLPFALVVKNGALIRLDAQLQETSIQAVSGPVVYSALAGRAYWSDGVATGTVDSVAAWSWGMQVPDLPVLTAVAGGGLAAGTYLVECSWLGPDGRESGTSDLEAIAVSAGGGIQAVLASAVPAGWKLRVFVSDVNGNKPYWRADIPGGVSTYLIGANPPGPEPEFPDCYPPLAGKRLAAFRGRILVGVDTELYWTVAGSPDHMKLAHNWIQVESDITAILPLDTGIYLVTEGGAYWLNGQDPAQWAAARVSLVGGVAGCGLIVPPNRVNGISGKVALWFGKDGSWWLGTDGGQVTSPNGLHSLMGISSGRAAYIEPDSELKNVVLLAGA